MSRIGYIPPNAVQRQKLNREPLSLAEKQSRLARQSRVVYVLPLRLRCLRNRAPGGEHLDETGDRGEPRVVARPNSVTSARVRQGR